MHDGDDEDDDYFYPEFRPNGARPTLASACARAATAAELRYRVAYPNSRPRVSRIIALDRGAAEIMHAITEEPWQGAHFLILSPVQPRLEEGEVRLTGANDGAALTSLGRDRRGRPRGNGGDLRSGRG